MSVFNDIIQLMLDLTDEQLEKVKAFILTKLQIIVNPISVEIRKCPYCNGLHIVKNGKNRGKQRFFCKDCNKNFVSTTNSIAANSRFSNETWINYVDCMLSGLSVRHTAYICEIDYKTAFYWRHKIIGSLKEVLDDKLSFLFPTKVIIAKMVLLCPANLIKEVKKQRKEELVEKKFVFLV